MGGHASGPGRLLILIAIGRKPDGVRLLLILTLSWGCPNGQLRLSQAPVELAGVMQDSMDRLNVSSKTVSTHKARLMDKLQARSLSDLVRYAMNHNLI